MAEEHRGSAASLPQDETKQEAEDPPSLAVPRPGDAEWEGFVEDRLNSMRLGYRKVGQLPSGEAVEQAWGQLSVALSSGQAFATHVAELYYMQQGTMPAAAGRLGDEAAATFPVPVGTDDSSAAAATSRTGHPLSVGPPVRAPDPALAAAAAAFPHAPMLPHHHVAGAALHPHGFTSHFNPLGLVPGPMTGPVPLSTRALTKRDVRVWLHTKGGGSKLIDNVIVYRVGKDRCPLRPVVQIASDVAMSVRAVSCRLYNSDSRIQGFVTESLSNAVGLPRSQREQSDSLPMCDHVTAVPLSPSVWQMHVLVMVTCRKHSTNFFQLAIDVTYLSGVTGTWEVVTVLSDKFAAVSFNVGPTNSSTLSTIVENARAEDAFIRSTSPPPTNIESSDSALPDQHVPADLSSGFIVRHPLPPQPQQRHLQPEPKGLELHLQQQQQRPQLQQQQQQRQQEQRQQEQRQENSMDFSMRDLQGIHKPGSAVLASDPAVQHDIPLVASNGDGAVPAGDRTGAANEVMPIVADASILAAAVASQSTASDAQHDHARQPDQSGLPYSGP